MGEATNRCSVLVGRLLNAADTSEAWAQSASQHEAYPPNYLRFGQQFLRTLLEGSTAVDQAAMTQSLRAQAGRTSRLPDIPDTLFASEMYPIKTTCLSR